MKTYVVSFIKCFPDALMERDCEVFLDETKAFDHFVKIRNEYINDFLEDLEEKDIYEHGCVTNTNSYWQFIEQFGQEEVLIILEEKEVN